MNVLETTIGIAIAAILFVLAGYFAWRQRITLRTLQFNSGLTSDQRRYYLKQTQRRLFGSVLLALMACMFVGALFLDYDLARQPLPELPPEEQESAKQALRFISMYWMSFLLLLMAVLALAVFDLWATARYGVAEQNRLFQEHQEILEAELAEHRHRQTGMN